MSYAGKSPKALICWTEKPVAVNFAASFSTLHEYVVGNASSRSVPNEGSVPIGISFSGSSRRASRLDGGKVFKKSGLDRADGNGSFLSGVLTLSSLGEKERGGVEATEVRRRAIRNRFKSAFLWDLLNIKAAVEANKITLANGKSHSFNITIEKCIFKEHISFEVRNY
jgi:hypothetical protein